MSEKRFKVDYEVGVLDTKTDEIITDCQNAEEVCDFLNSLYEENEQLKYDNFMFKGVIETFQKVAISERKKLEKENEQLRQQLKEKQEEEHLYANEIVKLNMEAKEVLNFKRLGGDY